MAGENPGLNQEQQAWLRQSFREARARVSAEDIEYVLKQGPKTFRRLTHAPTLLRQVYLQAKLLYRMLKDWWQKQYQLPWRVVAAITAGLLYVLNPFDLIPDVLPAVGAIDDLFVLGLVVSLIRSDLRRYCRAKNLDPADFGL